MDFIRLGDGRLIPRDRIQALIPHATDPTLYDVQVGNEITGQAVIDNSMLFPQVLPAAPDAHALVVNRSTDDDLGTVQQLQIVGWRLVGAQALPILPGVDVFDSSDTITFISTPSGYVPLVGEPRPMSRDAAIRWAQQHFADHGPRTRSIADSARAILEPQLA